MNSNVLKKLSLMTLVFCCVSSGIYGAAISGVIGQISPITDLQQLFTFEGKVVIKSKSVQPVYLMFFDGGFKKLVSIKTSQGNSSIIELKENEHIVVDPPKGNNLFVLVSNNKGQLDAGLFLPDGDKRSDYIWNLIKSSAVTGLNYFRPSENEVYLVYKNNLGLVPGLLRGAGEMKDKTFTKMGKLSTLCLVYKRKDTFVLVEKPKDYAIYAKKAAVKSSSLPTIEGVVDDVVAFEKAKGF